MATPPPKTYTPAERNGILAKVKAGATVVEVAKESGVPAATIYSWQRKKKLKAEAAAKANGKARPTKRGPSARKKGKRLPAGEGIAAASTAEPPLVVSLDECLAEVERVGATIRAIRDAARRVFGI